jgi:hypothetical protein
MSVMPDSRERLARISIRGRIALAARHLELTADALELTAAGLTRLTEVLWCFVSSPDRLDECERNLTALLPSSSEGWIDLVGAPALSAAQARLLVGACEATVEVATANLYAAVVGPSECTLRPLESVIRALSALGVDPPGLASFERAPFTEEHGWGSPRTREFFVENSRA